MAATRKARRRPSHTNTDGLTRNAGSRTRGKEVDPQAIIDAKMERVILEGVSHPIDAHSDANALPDSPVVFRLPVPRNGQLNDASVFCEQVIDGPAYLRVYDQDGPLKEKERDLPVEVALISEDWANLPVFEVTQGQRIRFEIDNVRTFPENMPTADRDLATGSPTLAVMGAWIAGMYFAEGGNRGSGQRIERAASPRPPRAG